MKFSRELLDMIDAAGDLGKLDNDDPRVLAIRRQTDIELGVGAKLQKKVVLEKKVKIILENTTAANLSKNRYLYLIQHTVTNQQICDQVKLGRKFLERWVLENKLTRTHQRKYHLTQNGVLVGKYPIIADAAKEIGVSFKTMDTYLKNGTVDANGYGLKLVHKKEPKADRLDKYKHSDTLLYWYENRPFRKKGKTDEAKQKTAQSN